MNQIFHQEKIKLFAKSFANSSQIRETTETETTKQPMIKPSNSH